MNVSVADVSVVATTANELTVPGTGAGGGTLDTTAVAVPATFALTALIVTVPKPTGVPTPLVSICTIDGLLLLQSTRRPVSTFPLESVSVAENCIV